MLSNEELVEAALHTAAEAHLGQKDKAGEPYILHPVRVMMGLGTLDPAERAIALLHDVVEDTHETVESLLDAGFPHIVAYTVSDLTKHPGEEWEHYIGRVRVNPLARRVKLSDLRDNMQVQRLWYLPHAMDAKMAQKLRDYLWAYKELQ